MKALQLHYTSCRRGQSGHAGFQTRTLTPGIRPDEQREIERRGIYRPPRDASSEPTVEEIAGDFPHAFRSCRLESGRLALIRSSYTGRDYSGRWGNFFAHTLILENGTEPPLWPIDFYEWKGWANPLDPKDDLDENPAPLPKADLDAVVPAESFRLAELQSFLNEQPGRPQMLARMGRAVFLGLESSRALVVRDNATDVLYWVACLQKLFPAPHAWSLSTSSYQDDPRGSADLNGTTGETGFTFDDSERRYRFYMFDLTAGRHSEVPETDGDYPAITSQWMAQDPDRLERFFTFMQRFNVGRPAPDLVSAVHLFELTEAPGAPDGKRLAGMISFAARYATIQGRSELLELLGSLRVNLTKPEDAETLVRFLAEGARETGQPQHRELALRAWLALVRRHLVDEGRGLDASKAAWSHLAELDPTTATLVLQDPLWDQVAPRIGNQPPETLVFLFQVAWRCLETVGRKPVWSQPEIEALIRAVASDPHGQALLTAVSSQPEALSAVSRQLAAALTPERAGRALGRVLAASAPTEAQEARRRLDREGNFDILVGEWLEIRDRSRQPVAAFEEYRCSILPSLPGLERQRGAQLRSSLLEALPELERVSLAAAWLSDHATGQPLSVELAAQCTRLANLAVLLDPDARDAGRLGRLVAESAAALNITLQPDRPWLRNVLTAARDSTSRLDGPQLSALRSALPDLRSGEYEVFISAFLPPTLSRAGTRREHQDVLLATFSASRAAVFEKSYLGFLKKRRKTSWPEDLHAALLFWIGFDSGLEETRPLATLAPAAHDGLTSALTRLKPEKVDEVRKNLTKSRIDLSSSALWRDMEHALRAKQRSPWARLTNLFVRNHPK